MEYIEKLKYIKKNWNNKKARQLFIKDETVIIKERGKEITATVVCQTEGRWKTVITANEGKTYHEVLTKRLKK